MTVSEVQAYVRAVLSRQDYQQWLKDQAAGLRPSWEEMARIYSA